MGRFFNTPDPDFVEDKIMELPTQLMGAVISNVDKQIGEGEQLKDSYLAKLLEVKAITQDKERRNQLIGDWETKIDDFTQMIQDDPLSFRSKIGDLKRLGRSLHTDMSRGELGAIQQRFNTRQDLIDRHKELIKKDPESFGGQDFNALLRYLDNERINPGIKFDKESGTYNQYQTEDLLPNQDLNTKFRDYLEDMKASSKKITDTKIGPRWIVETAEGVKQLTEQELLSVAWDNFAADRDLQSFLKQRSKIGTIGGIYDRGKMISPFEVENLKDAQGNIIGQDIKWNPRSGLTPAIRGAVNRSSFKEIERSRKVKANPYGLISAREASQKRLKDYDKYSDIPSVIIDGKSIKSQSLAGPNIVQAQSNAQAYDEQKRSIADGVLPVLDRKLGEDNPTRNAIYAQLQNGNYSVLRKESTKELLGIDDNYINDLEAQYKQIQYKQEIVQQKIVEAQNAVNKGLATDVNDYLNKTNQRVLGVTATWDVLPVDNSDQVSAKGKIIKQSQDLFDNMGLVGTVKMVSNDPRFDGKSLNDIIANDKVRVEQGLEPLLRVKTKSVKKEETDDKGVPITSTKEFATYGFDNFKVDKRTVAPTVQSMDDGSIALQAHGQIDGQGVTFYVSTNDISNTELSNMINQNGHKIKADHLFRQASDLGVFRPFGQNNDQVIIDNKNKNVTIEYSDGTWTGSLEEGKARIADLIKNKRM